MLLTCWCCAFQQEFLDGEDAFVHGWDAPPHFTGYISCNLCPTYYILKNETYRHLPIHQRWEQEGRPRFFDQNKDVIPEDRVPDAELQMLEKLLLGHTDKEIAELKEILLNLTKNEKEDHVH